MDTIKTFDVKVGTVGILPDGNETMLFPTEDEATEYIRQLNNEEAEEDSDE